MNKAIVVGALAGTLSAGLAFAQTKTTVGHRPAKSTGPAGLPSNEEVPTRAMTLGTVRVPRPVTADGQALQAGTYQVRLAGEALKPAVGETPNHEQWIEFLQGGKQKGKAVASIVPASDIHQVAKERAPAPGHARVDMLKGNEYVRVWINKGGTHYLIHLPVATS